MAAVPSLGGARIGGVTGSGGCPRGGDRCAAPPEQLFAGHAGLASLPGQRRGPDAPTGPGRTSARWRNPRTASDAAAVRDVRPAPRRLAPSIRPDTNPIRGDADGGILSASVAGLPTEELPRSLALLHAIPPVGVSLTVSASALGLFPVPARSNRSGQRHGHSYDPLSL
jgi:hypothetical protein